MPKYPTSLTTNIKSFAQYEVARIGMNELRVDRSFTREYF